MTISKLSLTSFVTGLLHFSIAIILLPGKLPAQYVWDDRGITLYAPFSQMMQNYPNEYLTVASTIDDADGVIRIVTTGYDLDSDNRFATQDILPDGSLSTQPEETFRAMKGISDTRELVPDGRGGYYALQWRLIEDSYPAGFFLQRLDRDFNPLWNNSGRLLALNRDYSEIKLQPLVDGTILVLVHEGSSGIIKRVGLKGEVVRISSTNNELFYSSKPWYRTSELIPDGKYIWLVFAEYLDGKMAYFCNRLDSSLNLLHGNNNKLALTTDYSQYAVTAVNPSGGFFIVGKDSIQQVNPGGSLRYRDAGRAIIGTLSGYPIQVSYSARDTSLYVTTRHHDNADINMVARVSMLGRPTVLWERMLSQHINPPMILPKVTVTTSGSIFHSGIYFHIGEDSLWALDRAGASIWAEPAKSLIQMGIPESFRGYNLKTGQDAIYIIGTVDGTLALVKVKNNGEIIWGDDPVIPFPKREKYVTGISQMQDGTLRTILADQKGISISDFSSDGRRKGPLDGGRLLDFEYPAGNGNSVGVYTRGSGSTVWLEWGYHSASTIGPYYKGLLLENKTFIPFDSDHYGAKTDRWSGPDFSDGHGGYYFYGADWPDYTGKCLEHMDSNGNFDWSSSKIIFSIAESDKFSYYHDREFVSDKGVWMLELDDDTSRVFIQHCSPDGRLLYPEGAKRLPFTLYDRTSFFAPMGDDRLFFLSIRYDQNAQQIEYICRATDLDLNEVWSSPITLYSEPLATASFSIWQNPPKVNLHPRKDGSMWVSTETPISDSLRSYSDLRIQLISRDGERLLDNSGVLFGRGHWEGYVTLSKIDRSDGLWLVWSRENCTDAYAQHFNSRGQTPSDWPVEGVRVTSREGFNSSGWAEIQHDNSLLLMLGSLYTPRIVQRLTADSPLEESPCEISLVSAYPNPFNDQFRIQYELSRSGDIQLSVSDLLGRTVVNEVMERNLAGTGSISVSSSEWSSGVYLIKLKTAAGDHSIKAVLIR